MCGFDFHLANETNGDKQRLMTIATSYRLLIVGLGEVRSLFTPSDFNPERFVQENPYPLFDPFIR
jgi:hypothetical protein